MDQPAASTPDDEPSDLAGGPVPFLPTRLDAQESLSASASARFHRGGMPEAGPRPQTRPGTLRLARFRRLP